MRTRGPHAIADTPHDPATRADLERIVTTGLDDLPELNPKDEANSARQVSILLAAATTVLDEEFKRSERLDAKSRNQVVVTGAFLAVAQAGVVSLLNGRLALADAATFRTILAITAALAAIGVIIAIFVSYQAWELRDEDAIAVETIKEYIPWAYEGHPLVGIRLASVYAEIAEDRRANNAARADRLTRAAKACGVALALIGVELAVAFIAIAVL